MKTPYSIKTGLKKYGRQWFTVFLTCLLFTPYGLGQIAAWSPSGLTSYGPSPWTATTANANLTVGGLTRGPGIGTGGTAASNAWGGINWTGAATQDASFTITANSGYQVSLTTLNLFYRRSSTGPGTGTLQYAIDASAYTTISTLTFGSTSGSGAAIPAVDLSGITALQNVAAGSVIHLRIHPTGGASTGTWYVYGTGLSVTGNVNPIPGCTTPSGFTTSALGSTTATIDWTGISGITGYEYVLDMNAADPSGAGTAITSSTYAASGLSPSTSYYLHVRTDCGGTYSSWTSYSFTTNAPCTGPAGLTVNSFNASSAGISWNSETGITGFEYVLDMNATDPAGAGTSTTDTSYSITTLSAATTYYFHLRKNCGSGDLSNWTTVSFTTYPPCTDPTGLTINSLNSSSVDISWDSETGITGFEYVLDMNISDPSGAGTPTTGNTFSDNTLAPSSIYYFHLRKNCGSGDFSGWINFSLTTNPACIDPTGLTVNSFNASTVDLSWDSETGITGFEYILDMSATDPVGPGTPTTGNTFFDNTLAPSTTYYFHLRKNCGSGDLSSWALVTFTTNPVCTGPTGLGVANLGADSVDLAWDNETGITGFEYVLDMNAADPTGPGISTTLNTFEDNTLSASTTYYFHLRKNCGSGDFSGWVTIAFTTPVYCTDPTSLATSGIGPMNVTIDWDNESGITGFEYVLDMNAADPTGPGTGTTSNSFTDNTLLPSSTYYFHLRKDCGSGNFSEWITLSFTTLSIATAITESNNKNIQVYPNPTRGLLTFTAVNGLIDGYLMVTDMTGKVLINTKVTGQVTTLDLSALAPQVYSLIYTNGHDQTVLKIVKQ